MKENYQSWMERVVGGRTSKPLNSGDIVTSSSGESFGVVNFVNLQRRWFRAEVGKKGKSYVYHIYPSTKDGPAFYKALNAAFLEIFKREDQVEADWVGEMKSWAVRVTGWTDNIWGDDLALRVIDRLDEILSEEAS